MRASAALFRLLVISLGAIPMTATALQHSELDRICIADAVPVPLIEKRVPIPIGCALVDCCPGCPAKGPIELRVHIDASIVTSAELTFEGISASNLGRLSVSGAGRLDNDRFLLREGTTRITGILAGDRNAVAILRPVIRRDAAKRLRTTGAEPTVASVTDQITVQQFRGPFVVNRFDWEFWIERCKIHTKPPTVQWDKLRITGLASGDDAVVMMDGRMSTGCQDGGLGTTSEQVFTSTGETTHPNILSPATGCNSELAIFSKNKAMKWEINVPWSDSAGEIRTVALDPVIEPEVHIWVMNDAALATAQLHFDKARELYRDNRVGVLFKPNIRKLPDATAMQIVRNSVHPVSWDCLDLGPIKNTLDPITNQPAFYTPKTLNIYYVDTAVGGKNCAIKTTPGGCTYDTSAHQPGDANITFLGTVASLTTLAHEIGHAYGLRPAACKGHLDSIPDNIMCSGGYCSNRSKLTLGQVFRMNTYADEGWGGTMLIHNNLSSRTGRLCKPNDLHTATCPALELRWPSP